MHKTDIRLVANWKACELRATICNGVESLAQTQTISERSGMCLTPMAYKTLGRKLTLYQRALVRMNRIAQGFAPFDAYMGSQNTYDIKPELPQTDIDKD